MTDHILSAALTFALLIGGTAAIGTELLGAKRAAAAPKPTAQATLPTVTIIGHRPAAAATAVAAVTPRREAQSSR